MVIAPGPMLYDDWGPCRRCKTSAFCYSHLHEYEDMASCKRATDIDELLDVFGDLSGQFRDGKRFARKLQVPMSGRKLFLVHGISRPLIKRESDSSNTEFDSTHLNAHYDRFDSLCEGRRRTMLQELELLVQGVLQGKTHMVSSWAIGRKDDRWSKLKAYDMTGTIRVGGGSQLLWNKITAEYVTRCTIADRDR